MKGRSPPRKTKVTEVSKGEQRGNKRGLRRSKNRGLWGTRKLQKGDEERITGRLAVWVGTG